MLTNQLHPVPRLRMSRAVPLRPLYVFHGVETENFTLPYITAVRDQIVTNNHIALNFHVIIIILRIVAWNWEHQENRHIPESCILREDNSPC
jgi:hypothetical protein